MTAPLNQPPHPRVSPQCGDKHDLACDHECVGCRAVSSVGVCRRRVSEDARKHLSLLTSSVCLAAPERWSVPCDGG